MSILLIPISSEFISYQFNIDLEKINYNLVFKYNERSDIWSMDIQDSIKNNIVTGIILLTGLDLMRQYVYSNLPPGVFKMVDTEGENKNAGRNDFGNRIILTYIESI